MTSRNARPRGSIRPGCRAFTDSSTSEHRRKKLELSRTLFRRMNSSIRAAGTAAGALLNGDALQQADLIQRPSRPHYDRGQRIVCQHNGEARLLPQEHIEITQQGAAPGEDDALVD